jgi:glycosyltransferase involved in cell wall biosynthesis
MTRLTRESSNGQLVTALIDTYNYGHFIEQAIDSVLAQDYPREHIEILVVDDGSTDDTAERVKKYGDQLHYLPKPNGGQASAFNFGFERARGEIIAFLDADDYWLPGKLSQVVRAFEEHPDAGLVYHRRMELNSATGESHEGNFAQCSGFLPEDLKSILEYRVLPTSSLAFSRGVLARMMPMPDWITLQADAYLALLVVFLAPVLAVPEILSVYRVHGQNLYVANDRNSSQREKHLSMRSAIFDGVRKRLGEHGFELSRKEIKIFFEQLFLFLDADKFKLRAPTRADFFKYMLRYSKFNWNRDRWKLRAMNAFNTVAGPLVGYPKFSGLYQKELRVIASLQRLTSKHT